MGPIERKRDPQVTALFIILAIVSALGAVYCAAVLSGIQSIPLHISSAELALYTAWFVVAIVSAVAILEWKKWGIYALGIATLIVTIVNIAQGSATWGGASLGVLIAFVLFVYLRPIWDEFE